MLQQTNVFPLDLRFTSAALPSPSSRRIVPPVAEEFVATSLADFAEQMNPKTLAEARRADFKQAIRVHGSFLAAAEKRALIWMAERMPRWVNSDHLTLIGFSAQIATGVCYALAAWNPRWLLAAIACIAINWFGDSLDGTLARVRQQQRPRYGFYVDHIIDSIGSVAMMGGLALSGFMHPVIAIGLLVAFLLLSIQSYLATYTLGEFHLSFWHFGPTELRVLLIAGNLATLRWPWVLHAHYRLFDVGGAIGLVLMLLMFVVVCVKNTLRLYREEKIV
jgi:archaetidylinositol phosphate synthase